MLAIVTTDYPLEPGEPASFLRTAVDASFNRISVDGECSTNDAVVLLANGASGVERTAARDEQFAAALGEVCAALAREIVADGEGSTVLLEIAVSGAVSDAEAEAVARRIATSPLVKTAAFGRDPNWGRVLAAAGSAPWNGGFAHVDTDRLSVSFDGSPVFVRGEPTGATARSRRHGRRDRPRPRPRSGKRVVPRIRSHLRLRATERGVHDVTRVVLKLGGRVAGDSIGLALERHAAGDEVVVVHGAGPQITSELRSSGIATRFVAGRRFTDPATLAIVRRSLVAVGAELSAALGPAALHLVGDEIGLVATRVPELGLVGEPLPCRPAAVEEALAAGRIPIVTPIAVGPLNVNADEAATALAEGLGADRIVFVSDVAGVFVEGVVAAQLHADDADELLGAGVFDGGIVPKLLAAARAARLGITAEIGETAVVA